MFLNRLPQFRRWTQMSLTNLYITKATVFLLFEHYYLIHNFTTNNILVISVLFTILKQIKYSDWVNFLHHCASAKLTFTRIKSLWLNTFSWNYFAPKHIGNPIAGLWKMRWANAVCDFAFPLCVYLPMLVFYGASK